MKRNSRDETLYESLDISRCTGTDLTLTQADCISLLLVLDAAKKEITLIGRNERVMNSVRERLDNALRTVYLSKDDICRVHDADDVVPGRICGRPLPCRDHK